MVLVAAVSAVVTRHGRHRAAGAVSKAQVPTTRPPRPPPPPGTRLLTEPVDPAQVAVPDGWQSISTDSRTLAIALRALEPGHPTLVPLLRAEETAADEGGLRLFAYTTTAPMTFMSIRSFSSPGVLPMDSHDIATYPASVKRSNGVVVEFHAVQLEAGGTVQVRTVVSTKTARVAYQLDVVVIPNRTVQLVLAVDAAAVPPAFSQIENSLRTG